MNRRTVAVTVGGAVVALAAGIGFGVQAMADDETPAPAPAWNRGWMGGMGGMRGGMTDVDWEARHAEMARHLAGELGVDEARVAEALDSWREQQQTERRAAMTEAMEERLTEAVEGGRLTQEQADAIRAAHESGALAGPGGMRGFGPRR